MMTQAKVKMLMILTDVLCMLQLYHLVLSLFVKYMLYLVLITCAMLR